MAAAHALFGIASAVLATGGLAADYPVKPIRLVVAQSPGGNADLVARAVAQKVGDALRQQVIVDNRGGGGGTIAADLVARANPDGYTILLVSSAFGVTPSLQKVPYDPIASFAPITLVAYSPNILVLHHAVPARSVKELIDLARAKPGQLNFGSSGSGGSTHLAGELFKHLAHVDMVHVPYKGAAAALIDVIAGNVQLMFASMPSAIGHVRSGKLKAIAVTSAKRSSAVPELPTVIESGLADFETTAWQGMFAPAGTSPRIVATLNAEVARAIRSPEMKERLATEGSEPVASSPAEFAAYIKREMRRWSDVVKATGMRSG